MLVLLTLPGWGRELLFSFGNFQETEIQYRRFTLSLTNIGINAQTITITIYDPNGSVIASNWELQTWSGTTFVTQSNGYTLPAGNTLLFKMQGDKNPSWGKIIITNPKGAVIGQGTMWAFINDSLRQTSSCGSGCNACCTKGVGSFASWNRSIFLNGGRPF